MMFKGKGGGVKGLLNDVKKTALFLHDGFPKRGWCHSTLISFVIMCTHTGLIIGKKRR